MINTYYSPPNYSKPHLPFGNQKGKADNLLKDFAKELKLVFPAKAKPLEQTLPKELFEGDPNYEYIQEVKIQLVKAEPGVLPANHRALNLVVNSMKDGLESSERIWLKKGTIPELQDYLRQNTSENQIKIKVSDLVKEAFEKPDTDY